MIKLQKISNGDLPYVQKYAEDPHVQKSTNLPSPYPSNGAEEWYLRIISSIENRKQAVYAIYDKSEFIGVVSLNEIDAVSKQAHLDYWIAYPHWGKGHGTKAALLAIEEAINKFGIAVLKSGCLSDNIGSRRVLEKCGFIQNGIHKYNGPFKDRYGNKDMYSYTLTLRAQ